MKTIRRIRVTKEGLEKLKEELTELEKKRPEAVITLSEARKMGDLSENGLYTAAKMRLRSIDAQLFRIKTQIKLADVIEPRNNGTVGLGSSVEVLITGKKRVFYLVGDFEANPSEDKISANSPLGKSLIGKKSGDEIRIKVPSGENEYKILRVF